MRLSNITSDYQASGGIVDRQQITVTDGTIREYQLTYVPGSEEVYVNGERKSSGASKFYTTSLGGGVITFNQDLVNGDELLLIGRSNVNEIPYTKATSEQVVLTDGQLTVVLASIETTGAEFSVSGPGIDSKRLLSVEDYSVVDDNSILLNSSYPAGTVLEATQSARLAWVDPNNMMINANGTVKSISKRFEETQSSYAYYVEKNGRQIASLYVGYVLHKWRMSNTVGILTIDPDGTYPTLVISGSAWIPRVSLDGSWVVQSWSISGDELSITAREQITLEVQVLLYVRSDGGGGSGGGLQWEAAPAGSFNGLEGFGYLIEGGTTCVLPASPTGALTVGFKDPNGSWRVSAAQIDPNGNTIEGSTDPFGLNVGGASIEIVYIDNDWKIVEIGAGGTGPTEIVEDTFGSGSVFTMSVTPANNASIIVVVDGSIVDTSGYSFVGTELTLTVAAVTSCSVRHLGSPTPIQNLQAEYTIYEDTNTGLGGTVEAAFNSTYVALGRKNLLINGGFNVWTRGTNFATGSDRYTADRWLVMDGSTATQVEVTASNAAYVKNHYGIQLTGTGLKHLIQGIELDKTGFAGQFQVGKTYILSFEMYSSTASAISVEIGFRDTVASATNQVANTVPALIDTVIGRNRYVVPFTIDAAPAGTSTCLCIAISSGVSLDTDWRFFDIQLEEGSVATRFEYRSISEEVSLCKRYYQEYTDIAVMRVTDATSSFNGGAYNLVYSDMRTVPTVNLVSTSGSAASDPNIQNVSSTSLILSPQVAWALGEWKLTDINLDAEL